MYTTETADQDYTAALESGEIVTSNVPWFVTQVTAHPGFRLSVKFIDGTTGDVLMEQRALRESAGVFTALADPKAFAKVFAEDGAVTWEDGLDLAPDAMYDEIKRHGVWVLR
jgi:hypothetical protein